MKQTSTTVWRYLLLCPVVLHLVDILLLFGGGGSGGNELVPYLTAGYQDKQEVAKFPRCRNSHKTKCISPSDFDFGEKLMVTVFTILLFLTGSTMWWGTRELPTYCWEFWERFLSSGHVQWQVLDLTQDISKLPHAGPPTPQVYCRPEN